MLEQRRQWMRLRTNERTNERTSETASSSRFSSRAAIRRSVPSLSLSLSLSPRLPPSFRRCIIPSLLLPFPYLAVHGALSLGFSAILLSAAGLIVRETVSFLFFLPPARPPARPPSPPPPPPPRLRLPRGRTIARNAIDIQRDFTRQQVRPLAAFYSGVLASSAVNGMRMLGNADGKSFFEALRKGGGYPSKVEICRFGHSTARCAKMLHRHPIALPSD